MKGHRIVFTQPGKAELQAFTARDPKDNEVLVQVQYTLISAGTEKAVFSGSPNSTADKGFPRVEGYSAVGTVLKTGTAVKRIREGDRVFAEYGGHGSYVIRPLTNIIPIPDGISPQEAVFAKVANFPLAAVRRSRLEIGESIVIVGLGMLGLFGVQFARLGGGRPVIAVGNREIRQEKARQFGADLVLSPSDPDLIEKIMDFTERKTTIRGASVVVETSGSESGLLNCLEYTARHGRVMLNGCQRVMTQPVDFYRLVHKKGVSITGVHGHSRMPHNSAPGNWTARRDFITVLGFMQDGRLDVKSLISEYADPRDAAQVYDRLLHDREFPLGVVFDWTKLDESTPHASK